VYGLGAGVPQQKVAFTEYPCVSAPFSELSIRNECSFWVYPGCLAGEYEEGYADVAHGMRPGSRIVFQASARASATAHCRCLGNGAENEAHCELSSPALTEPDACDADPRCHWGPGEDSACIAMLSGQPGLLDARLAGTWIVGETSTGGGAAFWVFREDGLPHGLEDAALRAPTGGFIGPSGEFRCLLLTTPPPGDTCCHSGYSFASCPAPPGDASRAAAVTGIVLGAAFPLCALMTCCLWKMIKKKKAPKAGERWVSQPSAVPTPQAADVIVAPPQAADDFAPPQRPPSVELPPPPPVVSGTVIGASSASADLERPPPDYYASVPVVQAVAVFSPADGQDGAATPTVVAAVAVPAPAASRI